MEIIDELEPVRRGIYGGAVDYLGWNGNMDTAIAIRTAVIKDGTLWLQPGGDVVADSVRLEWKESMNKGRACSGNGSRRARPRRRGLPAAAKKAGGGDGPDLTCARRAGGLNAMLLMIDNYDSFANVVQYLGELGADVVTHRNDEIDLATIERLAPEKIVISPGPCTPVKASPWR